MVAAWLLAFVQPVEDGRQERLLEEAEVRLKLRSWKKRMATLSTSELSPRSGRKIWPGGLTFRPRPAGGENRPDVARWAGSRVRYRNPEPEAL